MEALNLKQFMDLSKEIAIKLSDMGVGGLSTQGNNLQSLLVSDLLEFSISLSNADGNISDGERKVIKEYLDYDKIPEFPDRDFLSGYPECLKYAVLADAGRKLEPELYHNQCSMVFYDTFKLLGETIIASSEREINDVTMLKFTIFTSKMEEFIKELAVWHGAIDKYYIPKEPQANKGENNEEKLEEALLSLNSLTGLRSVKNQVTSLINLIRVQKMRKDMGLNCVDISKHMVFMGNPGTGKTTVARILADIYKYLGVLRKGQLIETDRSGLVRGYIGQTSTQTGEVINEALGGILKPIP